MRLTFPELNDFVNFHGYRWLIIEHILLAKLRIYEYYFVKSETFRRSFVGMYHHYFLFLAPIEHLPGYQTRKDKEKMIRH